MEYCTQASRWLSIISWASYYDGKKAGVVEREVKHIIDTLTEKRLP